MATRDRFENGAPPLVAPPADELVQLRAEVAMLRAQVQQEHDWQANREREAKEKADFLAWINLTTQEKTQAVADKMFPGSPGDEVWEVELQEMPKLRLHAHSEFEAIGRYAQVCGIIQTAHKYTAGRVGEQLQAAGV